ncbi:sigma factor-like helix-turn-helix DNA-binding protein [Paenibacillus sp. HB172176]|uniref:sigma factor-like helix-turn-helix DNA-binding protein n=1 Tax=Paenibacillus sp. HB172176 TaxID=2493690 RepID=UPI00143A9A09|nr:sigma factor-like helix-turn-helix DNA-binding protein [Paenibacillus sp. HB172176]
MSSITKLISEYTAGADQLDKLRLKLGEGSPVEQEDAKLVSGMLSDMRYALEWMKRGRRPGNRRGAERTDIYRQRELLEELRPLQDDEAVRSKLVYVLLLLTERERTCFLLHMAQGMTYDEIAVKLSISRSSVQTFCRRAKDKVQLEMLK